MRPHVRQKGSADRTALLPAEWVFLGTVLVVGLGVSLFAVLTAVVA